MVPDDFAGRWIEPFMGTGVVGFNLAPKRALMGDSNPHLIDFYQAIQQGQITAEIARTYLNHEGALLLEKGDKHYYAIRERFNHKHQPLDFLFINRSGFNGMLRFNRKGGFNIPFCKKPKLFTQAYVTKIVNQIDYVSRLLKAKAFSFKCQSFGQSIAEAKHGDMIYCDPPYIDRHVDYYNGWNSDSEKELFASLSTTSARFILSTWHHNDFRKNAYIESLWHKFKVYTREHFYHVGGSEKNRNPMTEAIISNYDVSEMKAFKQAAQLQLVG